MKKRDSLDTSPDRRHKIAPFVFAIPVVELYHASYGDTPPAQMIWKKQKVGSVNKKGSCAVRVLLKHLHKSWTQ